MYCRALQQFLNTNRDRNAEIIKEYLFHKESQGIGVLRLRKPLSVLKLFHKLTKKSFDSFTQKDLEKLVVKLLNLNKKEWTKVTYLKILKNFGRWLNKRYKLNLDLEITKPKTPKNSILPEYLIIPEDFNRLINATDDLQIKVLLCLLYESEARISEILSLRIQNVAFNQYGARIMVRGKTGQRVIPIVWFANLLRQYFEIHPQKDNPQTSLFLYKNAKGELKPLTYNVFRPRLRKLCKRAGIKKRIHHTFLGIPA